MGRLLDRLKRGAPAYDVKVERDGFTLIGKPDHICLLYTSDAADE